MNTPGPETESPAGSQTADVPPVSLSALFGLKLFVYVISILAGLIAGLIIASMSWSGSWPDGLGRVGPPAGALGGAIAAWFWTTIMTRHVRNRAGSAKIIVLGVVWGLLVGWLAAAILWFCESLLMIGNTRWGLEMEFSIAVHIGVFICGSVGGMGAGVLCGVVWAIRLQPKQ